MSKHINTGTEYNPDPIPQCNKKSCRPTIKTETDMIVNELLKEYEKIVDELVAYYNTMTKTKVVPKQSKDVILKVPRNSVSKIIIYFDRD